MTSATRIDRKVIYGLIFPVLIGLVVAASIAQYRGAFDDDVVVSVETDRAGLTLASGAPVKLRGVEIGKIGGIEHDDDSVLVELRIKADQIGHVPADVTAQIVPPTAFGGKYVQLTAARRSSAPRIEAGAVIPATRVTVEIDEAFTNLTEVLDVARPASVNAALTAMAGAVDERGEIIGDLIELTDAYLTDLNPALPTLSADLRVADDVLDVYDAIRPDLIRTLRHSGTISQELVRQQASLRAYTRSLSAFSDEADALLRSSEHGIVTSMTLLEPVARTLARYSPELPCLVMGLASANKLAEAAAGGTLPGINTFTRLVPGRAPYEHPRNLPVVGDKRGPECYGLPHVTPAEAEQPTPWMYTGANPYSGEQPSQDQAVLDAMFGSLVEGADAR